MSTYPDRYRGVSVTDVDVPLEAGPLRDLLMARPVYRRSNFMVVRSAGKVALLRLVRGAETGLFAPLEDVELLAGPDETVYLQRPDVDTAVPTALLTAAVDVPGARCVVVEGAYGHVSFVLDPAPVRVHVLDVVPPRPAKLVDQLRRVLATADDLPGLELVPHVIELADLLPSPPDDSYLLPCRGGGLEVPGASVAYLDEVPPRQDWTLLGCTRSRQIHDVLYGGPVRQIDMCPRALAARVELPDGIPDGEVLLTKCCLFEDRNEVDGRTVLTPWGASFGELREALATAVDLAMAPATAPMRP
ncbi:hypothetical protein GCM10010531_21100 [Blastococcus jejuensis]|uniref:Hemin transport protein n=1 Tax=Blastococcus jejuensis TaxID=351224 RepID=A0ABP6P5P9_9ACTN